MHIIMLRTVGCVKTPMRDGVTLAPAHRYRPRPNGRYRGSPMKQICQETCGWAM